MNKKNNAKTRLVIWSVLALVLLVILVAGLLPKNNPAPEYAPAQGPAQEVSPPVAQDIPVEEKPSGFGSDQTANLPQVEEPAAPTEEQPSADPGTVKFEATDISRIHVEWPAGSVTVMPYDGTSVQFGDDYDGGGKYQLHHFTKNGELTIRFCEDRSWTMLNPPDKNLTVQVPQEQLKKLDISTASANVTVGAVNAGELDIETASGQVSVQNAVLWDLSVDSASGSVAASGVTATEFSVDTASGDVLVSSVTAAEISADTASGKVSLEGAFTEVEVDTASGQVLVASAQMPQQIDCSSLSGEIELRLPENETFFYQFETLSGADHVSHPGASMRRDSERVEIETASGDLTIGIYQ